jgi:Bacterial PH domain
MTEVFPMVPAPARALWFLAGIGAVLAALIGVFAFIAYSSQTVRFEVSPAGLRLRGDFFGRAIPAGSIVLGEARAADFAREPALRPARRTWGTALPGYVAGWCRLRSGESALLYLTDRSRAVYVPTREGFAVLVSVNDPEAFLRALRAVAPGS